MEMRFCGGFSVIDSSYLHVFVFGNFVGRLAWEVLFVIEVAKGDFKNDLLKDPEPNTSSNISLQLTSTSITHISTIIYPSSHSRKKCDPISHETLNQKDI